MAESPFQNSPKSSPRGSRSPGYSGSLKATISLGKNPHVISAPSEAFYLMRDPAGKMNIRLTL